MTSLSRRAYEGIRVYLCVESGETHPWYLFGNMVAPGSLCEISLSVGALKCSLMIALFKSLGSKHMCSVPSGLCGYVIDETHSVGSVTGVIICRSSMS